MTSTLKRITSVNLQTHEHVEIELPETGLVRFRGDNSEGKSVIVKVINDAVTCALHRKKYRNPLIQYGQESGQLILERYDGIILIINLDREASKTYYELHEPGIQPIRRYLSDKNVQDLIWRFGWHYLEERNFSINIYNTYDPLLFLNTSSRLNFEVLDSAVTDPQAEKAIQNLDITMSELKLANDESVKGIMEAQNRLASLKVWDIEQQQNRKDKLEYLAHNIEFLGTPDLYEVLEIPDISMIEYLNVKPLIESIGDIAVIEDNIFELLDSIDAIAKVTAFKLPDFTKEIHAVLEYTAAIENEECPVCGRGYSEHEQIPVAL